MLPIQDSTPPANARIEPRVRPPGTPSFFDNATQMITGANPIVDKAWLCAADSASPITFESNAHTPQQARATSVQVSQRGITGNVRGCDRAPGGRVRLPMGSPHSTQAAGTCFQSLERALRARI